jgi:hypothetical protein
MDVLLDSHVTDLPVTTFPFVSFVVAVACVVLPTPIVEDAIDTVTDPTAAETTVTAADPLWPSLVAVMLADPAATAVTNPALFTVATSELSDSQDIARPDRVTPFASLAVAVAWVVPPTTMVEAASDTATVATGGSVTVSAADPVCPSLVAVM